VDKYGNLFVQVGEACHCTVMFVRFRPTKTRVQASLVETRRVDGKVPHEHIASLDSVLAPPSIADRVAFWKSLHERLARLSNGGRAAAIRSGRASECSSGWPPQ